MIAVSDVTVGWILLVGIVIIGLFSMLPIAYIKNYTLHGRRAFQLIGSVLLFVVVFFFWAQGQQDDLRDLADSAVVQADTAEDLSEENATRIEDIERVRADAEYTACVDRNETRQRVRREYRSIVAQEQANLDRLRVTPPFDLSQIPGYSDLQDPAVIEVFDSVTAGLAISRTEAINRQQIEVTTAQATLDTYVAAEPFERCGNDPIPAEDPVRPPITAATPQPTVAVSTTSTTTTTTTTTTTSTTIPPSTTARPVTTNAPTPAPTPRPTTAPTTTDRPGNAGGNGNGNAGGNGNGNDNGNGRGNR